MAREKGSPITYQDRVLIEKLYKNTYYKDLEKHVGIPYQSIYRELKRCPKNRYTADAAQANVDKRWEEGKKERQETMKRQSEKKQVKKILLSDEKADVISIFKITNIPKKKIAAYVEEIQEEMKEKEKNEK